ncbi:MAG: hypothetical protein OEX11_01610 [Nitrosomonas sp.]|nr:hypothetical protein [Nitrosomonas sp.]
MVSKRNYAFLFLLALFLYGTAKNSYATHISEPVLIKFKTEYLLGEKIVLNGWAEYNAQPTADVLLNLKVSLPDGTVIIDQSQQTDQQGHFEFEFDTKNLTPGIYQTTITSHCQEIHRSICTYKNQTVEINLK